MLTVQNLRQQASGSEYVKIFSKDGSVINETTEQEVQLQITLPPDWQLPTQGRNNSIIKQAYAQTNASTCLDINVNNGTLVSPGNPYTAVVRIRNDGDTNWTWDSPNSYKLGSQDPQDNSTWSIARVDLPTSPITPGQTATFRFTIWPPETEGVQKFNWQMVQEGVSWFGSRCYYNVTVVAPTSAVSIPTATETPLPSELPTIQPTEPVQPTNPDATQTPTIHILKQIIIENKDGGSGGTTMPPITGVDIQRVLSQGISWKLNALKTGETQATRVVQVTLFDGANYLPLVTTITLKKSITLPTGIPSPNLSVKNPNKTIQEMTSELIDASNENSSKFTQLSKEQRLSTMTTLAKQRYAKLVAQIESNPQEFINQSTLINQRDTFHKEIQQYIERNISETGKVNIHIAENLDNKGKTYHSLVSNNKEYFLFSDRQMDISSGSTVSVRGVGLGKAVAVTNIQKMSLASPSELLDSYPQASGEIKIGVVEIKFTDRPKENTSFFSNTEDFMTTIIRPLNSYYQTISHNKLSSITPDILGIVSIDSLGSKCGVATAYGWADAVDEELAKNISGFSRDQYFTIMYILPDDNDCFWAGLANIGIKTYRHNRLVIAKKYRDLYVYTHELGHNLGLAHAAYVTCGNKSIGTYKECDNYIEYGDVHDIMGKPIGFSYENQEIFPLLHPNAPHQEVLGILGENETIIIEPTNNTQKVKVTPLERAQAKSTTPIPYAPLIKIPKEVKDPGGTYYYYIEYRRPIFYDIKLPEKMTQGVSIHIWNGATGILTELINPNIPRTSDVNESALADGESFYDHLIGLRIKQINHDTEGAVIEISKDSADSTVNTLRNTSGHTNTAESNPQYKLFTQCFKEKANTVSCPDKNAVDYNKDGKVDEQDYKLFLQSL